MATFKTPGVYVSEASTVPPTIEAVSTSIAVFVGRFASGPVAEALRVRTVREFREIFRKEDADVEAPRAVEQFYANGGREAWIVRTGPQDGELVTALAALEDLDAFNILCIPDTAGLRDDQAFAAVARAATACCVSRRAFYILDAPAEASRGPIGTAVAMRRWIDDNAVLRSSNVATYFPRPIADDLLRGGAARPVAPGGTLAGLYVRTDRKRGVFKAPAGLEANLRGVTGLEVELDDAQQDLLNPRGVNCLRHFPGAGFVSWGARTLSDDAVPQWKYVPVRRLALLIEESIEQGTRWVVSEPNGEPTWARLRQSVNNFMNGLFRQGAFQGSTPRESWFVKCDGETTTSTDLLRGVLNLVVGFAPLEPAEFVELRFRYRVSPRNG